MTRAEFWERIAFIFLMPQATWLEDNTSDAIWPLQLLIKDMETDTPHNADVTEAVEPP